MRSIAKDAFDAVKTLTDVGTPVKRYSKLFAQIMKPESVSYQTAPLMQVSEMVFVDSKVKWRFRNAVKSYLINKDAVSENFIVDCLNRWKGNDKQLKSLFESASQLKAVEEHSKNLAQIAEIGIDALSKLKNGTTPDATKKMGLHPQL